MSTWNRIESRCWRWFKQSADPPFHPTSTDLALPLPLGDEGDFVRALSGPAGHDDVRQDQTRQERVFRESLTFRGNSRNALGFLGPSPGVRIPPSALVFPATSLLIEGTNARSGLWRRSRPGLRRALYRSF